MLSSGENHHGSLGLFPVGELLKEEVNHSQRLARGSESYPQEDRDSGGGKIPVQRNQHEMHQKSAKVLS